MLITLLSAFLASDRAHALANTVLTASQLALARGDGIHNVLPPDLRVGATGDCRGGECGGSHDADGNRSRNDRGPGLG
jgi:hypothetical protein